MPNIRMSSKTHNINQPRVPLTSGDRGGADLTVMVVLRLDSHEWETMAVGARDMTARLASSVACEIVPLSPCRAAMIYVYGSF